MRTKSASAIRPGLDLRLMPACPDEQRRERRIADNPAAVTMYGAVKNRAFRQQIVREKMFARLEYSRAAILQSDFHFAAQHYQPLRCSGAMKIAADARRAVPDLKSARRKQL